MKNNDNRPVSKAPYVVGGILGIAVVGSMLAWAFGMDKNAAPAENDDQAGNASSTDSQASSTASGAYKDGQYAADGTYTSPAGQETVKVGITLKDGVVVNSSFEGQAKNPTSIQLQTRFASGYRAQVVGKKIDAIDLGVVNGASLAPKGFMDALTKIKAEAQG